jgi:hypothetical protein
LFEEANVKRFRLIVPAVALALTIPSASVAKGPPAEWDGLVRVASKQLAYVYLQPGADFRDYSKVMLEPTEVAFHKNWMKDYNRTQRSLSGKVSDRDVQQAVAAGIKASSDIFAKAWQAGGYTLASAPGPDVLRVTTGILNISVNAPDTMTAGITRTYSDEAGHATLVVEVRDSVTGALLGRAVDQQIAGDYTTGWRTAMTNRSDFRQIAELWARESVKGMAELKARSPIAP